MKTNRHDWPRRRGNLFLKEWAHHRKMTLEKLAELINTSKGSLSNLASGKRRYNRDWLEQIAHALSCDVPDLFYPPEQSPQNMEQKSWEALLSAAIDAAAQARISPLVVDAHFRDLLAKSAHDIVQQIASTGFAARQRLEDVGSEALVQSRRAQNDGTQGTSPEPKTRGLAHKGGT